MLMGLPWWLSGKEPACSAGEVGLIPGLGRSTREENGDPLRYSRLGNPKDRGAWRATDYGITTDWTQLSHWLNNNNKPCYRHPKSCARWMSSLSSTTAQTPKWVRLLPRIPLAQIPWLCALALQKIHR